MENKVIIPTLLQIKVHVSSEVGCTKVGGSGCDKDNIQYGTSDDEIINIVYDFILQSLKEPKEKEKCTACSGYAYYCGKPCGACNGTGHE